MHLWDSIPGRSYQGKWAGYCQLMTEPQPTLAGYGEVLVLQMGVAYAADESFPEDQWCIPQDVVWRSYYRISQQPNHLVESWYCSKMDVAYAADESFPEDQWCTPQDVVWRSYYRISQQPRSPCSVSKLLQPSVALVINSWYQLLKDQVWAICPIR